MQSCIQRIQQWIWDGVGCRIDLSFLADLYICSCWYVYILRTWNILYTAFLYGMAARYNEIQVSETEVDGFQLSFMCILFSLPLEYLKSYQDALASIVPFSCAPFRLCSARVCNTFCGFSSHALCNPSAVSIVVCCCSLLRKIQCPIVDVYICWANE